MKWFQSAMKMPVIFAILAIMVSCGGGVSVSPAPPPPQITSSQMTTGSVGVDYAMTLAATGGSLPYTWSLTSGKLPASLALSATGNISGIPSTPGSFDFTVQVTDAKSQVASKPLSLTISAETLDQYGGLMSKTCASATGWFQVEKIGNAWWFCTPEGHAFWMQGVFNIGTYPYTTDLGTNMTAIVTTKYGDTTKTYGPQVVRRLKSWGFNSVGEFTTGYVWPTWTLSTWPGDHTQPVKVPMVAEIRPSTYALNTNYTLGGLAEPVKSVQTGVNVHHYNGWDSGFPDLWDPNFGAFIDYLMDHDNNTKINENSPWVLFWTTDEADELYGLAGSANNGFKTIPDGHYQRQQALMTLIQSPVLNANPNFAVFSCCSLTYLTPTNYTKAQFLAWLKARYNNSISALDTAWGSSYSGFDSAGTQVTAEAVATGDGTSTSFPATLAHTNVSPYSIAIKVNGAKMGGDCPEWTGCNWKSIGNGGFTGSTTATYPLAKGTVNYADGTVTIVFTVPPPAGAPITVDYIHGGWSYGNTVMDEDGRNIWIPTSDPVNMTGATAAFQADMNAFLVQISQQYFSTVVTKVRAHAPNHLVFGPGVMGTWQGVPSAYVLQGAAEANLDGMNTSMPTVNPQPVLDYWAHNFGDKPLTLWHGAKATADSALWRYENAVDTPCNPCNTQAERGAWYEAALTSWLNATNSAFGSRPIAGFRWWGWMDQWPEGNWGLVDEQDNAYNGVEDCSVSTVDPWGYTTYPEENIPAWGPATIYAVPNQVPSSGIKGNRIQALASDGKRYEYEVTVAGTSGSSAPGWPTSEGVTVTDGTVTWRNSGLKASATCYGDVITPMTAANALWMK